MGERSAIEWTDATWNPTVGCTKVSPGCDHCYAETFVNRFAGSKGFPLPFDELRLIGDRFLSLPLTKWREPRRIFVNSLSDLFHDDVPDETIADVFAVMAVAEQHTFQLLTKRHGRMRSLLSSERFGQLCDAALRGLRDRKLITAEQYVAAADVGCFDLGVPLPNVWLGVSVEDQKWADVRIPALLATPAAVRWTVLSRCSARSTSGTGSSAVGAAAGSSSATARTSTAGRCSRCRRRTRGRLRGRRSTGSWSAARAVPVRDRCRRIGCGLSVIQCAAADVPFLLKQWGSHDVDGNRVSKHVAGRELDGALYDGYPDSVGARR